MSTSPLYIGGLSYSGKTQLSHMLMGLPGLTITRRTYLWPRYYQRFGDLSREANLAACLDAMLAAPGIRALSPDRRRIEQAFGDGPATYARLFAILHAQHAADRGARRWGDQLGGIEQYAEPILADDATARFIHMVRDPRGRQAMIARAGRRPGVTGWETRRWRQSAGLGLRQRDRYSGRYLLVRYEDLRGRAEETLRQVCAFIGEPYSPALLPDPTLWDSDPYPRGESAVGARTAVYIQRHAAAEMAALEYEWRGEKLRLGDSLWLWLVDEPLNAAGMLVRDLRHNIETGRTRTTPTPQDKREEWRKVAVSAE
jgi:hypothetical protein